MQVRLGFLRILLSVLVFVCPAAIGQDQTAGTQEKPLGDVARENKRSKPAKATVVVTEDKIRTRQEIIPAIFSGGIDNSDEIMRAILAYRATHKPGELETVIRAWYDDYDSAMAHAIEENKRIEDGQPPDVRSQQEYEAAVKARRRELQDKKDNGLLIARIQQTFQKVRSELKKIGVEYEWFKIRCGNGNCSY